MARAHDDPVARATRVYLEEPSFCLGRNRDIEFVIKTSVAKGLGVSYRSIVIAGSAQLGFSPYTGRPFAKGESDLDLAIIDARLFGVMLELCINVTKAFTQRGGIEAAERLRDYITRRGMIMVKNMPACKWVVQAERVLAQASATGANAFSEVNLAVYMSESLFAWKQHSGLNHLLTRI